MSQSVTGGENWTRAYVAENDLSSDQFKLLELSADFQVDVIDGADDHVIGVLQNKPEAGQHASVAILGATKVLAGDTISAGDLWKANATGFAVAASSGDDGVLGIAESGASSGYPFSAIFFGPGGTALS